MQFMIEAIAGLYFLIAGIIMWETGGARHRHTMSFLILGAVSLITCFISLSVQADNYTLIGLSFAGIVIGCLFIKDWLGLRSLMSDVEHTVMSVEIRAREIVQTKEKLQKIVEDIQGIQDDIASQHMEFSRRWAMIHAD